MTKDLQIPKQKHRTNSKPHRHKNIIQNRQRTPTRQRDRDPDQIRIAVQGPTLQHIRPISRAKPFQNRPQSDR